MFVAHNKGSKMKDLTNLQNVGVIISNISKPPIRESAEKIKQPDTFGEHCGYNFHGIVWFEDDQYHEEVCVHRNVRGTYHADTLEELVQEVNSKYGSE
jgi:hypothetical protein